MNCPECDRPTRIEVQECTPMGDTQIYFAKFYICERHGCVKRYAPKELDTPFVNPPKDQIPIPEEWTDWQDFY